MALYIDRYGEQQLMHPIQGFWHLYKTNNTAMFGLLILSLIALILILSPLLAPYEANAQFIDALLSSPSWSENGRIEFLFGTDDLGRDIFSRILIGGRTTLSTAMLVVFFAALVGVLAGLISSFIGGWFDKITSSVIELFMTFPSLITSLLVVAILGPGLVNSAIAVSFAMLPHFFKSTRNAMLTQMKKPYYAAARLDGARGIRLLTITLLPNITNAIFIQFSLSLSTAILEISTLGFLGFGAQSPLTEWGAILGESRSYSYQAPWTIWLPGLSMLVTIFSINLVGDGIRETFESDHHLR